MPFLVTPPERRCSGATSAEGPMLFTFSSACAVSMGPYISRTSPLHLPYISSACAVSSDALKRGFCTWLGLGSGLGFGFGFGYGYGYGYGCGLGLGSAGARPLHLDVDGAEGDGAVEDGPRPLLDQREGEPLVALGLAAVQREQLDVHADLARAQRADERVVRLGGASRGASGWASGGASGWGFGLGLLLGLGLGRELG